MKDLTTELTNLLHETQRLRESQLIKKFPFFCGTNTSLPNATSSRVSAVHTLTVYFYEQSF